TLLKNQYTQFIQLVLYCVSMFTMISVVKALLHYASGRLALEIRAHVTKVLHGGYVKRHALYAMKVEGKIDNPDMRITQDLDGFCNVARKVGNDKIKGATREASSPCFLSFFHQ